MLHDQILEKLKNFKNGQLTCEELEEWIVAHLQQIIDSREERAVDLANDLDALFIQGSEGLLSDDEIYQEIAALYNREISTAWIEYGAQEVRSSSEHTVQKSWGEPTVVTGLNTRLLVA